MLLDALVPRHAPLLFNTGNLPQHLRAEAWNAAFGRLNEITLPDPRAPGLATGTHWDLGGAIIGHNRITAARFLRDPLRARRDGLDHWVIRVLRRGECRLRHDGFSARLHAGDGVIFSMNETWLCEWSDAEWVSFTLPRARHPELGALLAAHGSGRLHGRESARLVEGLATLPERLAIAQPHALPTLANGLFALLQDCLSPGATSDDSEARRRRAREAIRRRIASVRLTPASLAAELGLSRSALYRLFEGEGGVARQIQEMRLALAHAALRDPARHGESVASIGAAHGFPDPAVFSRSFRRAFGLPPGALRGGAAAAREAEAQPASDLAARLYAPWNDARHVA